MSHFCLLRDPDNYCVDDWDLLADEPGRLHWVRHFEKQFQYTLKHAARHSGRNVRAEIDAAGEQFRQWLTLLRDEPSRLADNGVLRVIDLDRAREEILRSHHIYDAYEANKREVNAAAEDLFPNVVRELHALEDEAKWEHLIRSAFAGNLFDLGATVSMHLSGDPSGFFDVLDNLKPRPWLADDFDGLLDDLMQAPPAKWGKAVIFVDNAGADFILGVMPLARELALAGTQVVLAANEQPALNDMTVDETIDVVERLGAAEPTLLAMIEAGMFEVASTGNDLPLIDLSDVSDELNEASHDADLVILEGMGRAVLSNYNAAFSVDCLHLAMLKDPAAAERIGGEPYDCICKYTPRDED